MCSGFIYLLFLQLKLCVLSKRDMFRPAKLARKSVIKANSLAVLQADRLTGLQADRLEARLLD